MTPEEARHFDRHSVKNAEILTAIRPDCEPYKDWFTYKRWLAQGMQVAKGQKGTKIFIQVENKRKDKEGKITLDTGYRSINVFHRHQLKN